MCFFSETSHIQRGQLDGLAAAHIRHRVRHHLEKLVPIAEGPIGVDGARNGHFAREPEPIVGPDPDEHAAGLAGHVGRCGQGGRGAAALVQKIDRDGARGEVGLGVREMAVCGVEIDLAAVRLRINCERGFQWTQGIKGMAGARGGGRRTRVAVPSLSTESTGLGFGACLVR